MPIDLVFGAASRLSYALIQRIHTDVLSRAQRRLQRSDEQMRRCVGLQAGSTERLLDPDSRTQRSRTARGTFRSGG